MATQDTIHGGALDSAAHADGLHVAASHAAATHAAATHADASDAGASDAMPVQALLAAAAQGQVVDSGRLLQGRREVLIRHGEDCYRLRHTRNDKLILTK